MITTLPIFAKSRSLQPQTSSHQKIPTFYELKRPTNDNNKFMKHESVARVVTDGKKVTLGTIIPEEDLLAKKPPILCLQIPGKELERTLRCLLGAESIKVVQLNTAVFAYLLILTQLQEIKNISVEDEILHWETGKPLRPGDAENSTFGDKIGDVQCEIEP
ncbi:MAG: hypothetical protein Q9179_004850 [Wetmoreana sp. 5 TL-2023]